MASVPNIDWLKGVARQAGELVRKGFFESRKEIKAKLSSADLVTATDVAVENFLVEQIRLSFPEHKFFCEETYKPGDFMSIDPTWVIDPIDGTTNFVHTLPFIAISIGFCVDKKVKLGIVYNPIMEEMFYAESGKGAFLESPRSSAPERLSVSPKRKCEEAVVSTGFSISKIRKLVEHQNQTGVPLSDANIPRAQEVRDVTFHNAQQLMLHCRDIRRLGSCAVDLAFVAAGRMDALCELGVKEWDICAGVLLIEEAGGVVMNYDQAWPADISRRQVIGASSRDLAVELASFLRFPSFDEHLFE